jgi:serine/threonine protein kinase/Tfp pilus assembly protein PilF
MSEDQRPPDDPEPTRLDSADLEGDANDSTRTAEPDATREGDVRPDDSSPGKRLGDFELLRELGRGGMGVVYAARQVSLDRRVALKVLPPALGLTSQSKQRFEREARAAAKLHHTNIVPVHAVGECDGHHFYAMDLIEGQSLDHVLHQVIDQGTNALMEATVTQTLAEIPPRPSTSSQEKEETSLSDTSAGGREWIDTVAKLMAEVADGLHYAHGRGVIHRDIKPANLMLSKEGRLCVTDFGLARVLQEPGITVTGSFLGTPAYMSPEQIAAGRIKVDHRTDVYSLGVVLYEMLTMQRPFPGESREEILNGVLTKEPRSPRRINAKIPVDLETICLKALEKEPDRRYATAGELASDLRQYLQHGLIAARRAGLILRTAKWTRRHPVAATVIVAVLIVVAASVVAWRAGGRGEAAQRLVADARLAFEQGRETAARVKVEEALAVVPDHLDARLLRARLLGRSGKGREAAGEALALLEKDPENWKAHLIVVMAARSATASSTLHGLDVEEHVRALEANAPDTAEAYYARAEVTNKPQDKLRLLDRALELDPGHPEALLARCNLYRGTLKDFRAALADADRLMIARPRSSQGRRMRAYVFMALHDLPAALREIDLALERDSEDLANYVARASIYRSLGQIEDALEDHNRTLELDPANESVLVARAGVLQSLARLDEARNDLERALEINPDYPDAHASLIGLLVTLDDKREARAAMRRYEDRAATWTDKKSRAESHRNLMWNYRGLGEYDLALAQADMAIEIAPEGDRFLYHGARAEARRLQGDMTGASEDCHAMAEFTLSSPGELMGRRWYFYNACDMRERAIEELDRVIELAPNWADAYQRRAYDRAKLYGYDERTITDLDRAIELAPNWGEAYRLRGMAYNRLGHFDRALADYDRFVELQPENGAAYTNRAAGALMPLGRVEQAIRDYDRAMDLLPGACFIPMYRAGTRLYLKPPDCAAASADYEKALGLCPGNEGLLCTAAWLHLTGFYHHCPEIYDLDFAMEQARREMELHPSGARGQRTLGVALYRAGRYEEAAGYLQLALERGDAYPQNMFFLAMVYWQLGRSDDAREHYRLAVAWMDEHYHPNSPRLIPLRDEAAELMGI